MRTKVFVRGPVLSRSGYGEHARFILRSLRSQHEKFDIYVQNINWGQTGWIFDDNEEREWIDRKIEKTSTLIAQNKKPAYDMSIQVTIPQEFENLARVNLKIRPIQAKMLKLVKLSKILDALYLWTL